MAGDFTRRRFLTSTACAGAGLLVTPGFGYGQTQILSEAGKVGTPFGAQVGDIRNGSAIVWSKADRPSRMQLRWSTTEDLRSANESVVVNALEASDNTARIDLYGLPGDQTIFYEIGFTDLADLKTVSAPVRGRFRTPPVERRDIRFVWSGDTVGQGWGINPDFGGMRIYETMRRVEPDFFIHSGDTIYADGPIKAEAELPDGSIWKNVTTEAKSKVAETLAEYRGQYAYNLLDENLRRFNAEVPMLAQWDDHEVTNNWYWQKRMDNDERYKEGSVALMAANAMRAFHDYMPIRSHPIDPDRLYQSFPYGPSLEVFRIDLRSYRGANSDEQPTTISPETRILGRRQLEWLKLALKNSKATWKVIASDMPIGLIVYDQAKDRRGAEAIALRDGPAAGRELEIAELLTWIRDNGIRNTVWLTADVHYTAAHHYDPSRAQYTAFAPFWEFVSGPLNAGSFGPNTLDNTFGPEARFVKAPPEGQVNLAPSAGFQFFGQVDISGDSELMTVSLVDIAGDILYSTELQPEV
ncbi:MAG: alkaline phosphatase D family protein [Geminicoccaceae bacterium]